MKAFVQSLGALWGQLGLNQRVSLVVAALGVIGALVGLTLWSQRPDYQLLYGRLGEKDASVIISTLQAQNIPHRVEAGGGAVYVPSEHVHRLRMELAGKGLPSGEGVGFEIFDRNQFGLSDFVQRTNYARAIQGELARTIGQLDGVRSARVMIVQPENRLLLSGSGVKPSASVFVELSRGRLEVEAVNAIRHLVANAVQGLVPDEVAVIDHRGRVLSADLREDPLLTTASSQMRYRQQVEDYFSRKVETMLARVVGEGNAVVRVSADIEHEAMTSEEVRYDPDGQVVRSQTSTENMTNSVESRSGGAVGVTANTPGAPAAPEATPVTSNEQQTKERTTSYEINRRTTSTTRAPGTIRSLTASVFVAPRPATGDAAPTPRTPEEIEALRRVVINALGLKAADGADITSLVAIQEAPFLQEEVVQQVQAITDANVLTPWIDLASRVAAVVMAGVVLLIFWRMLRREKPQPVPLELLTAPPAGAAAAGGGGSGSNLLSPDLLNELIRQKPAHVGTALREWVAVKKN